MNPHPTALALLEVLATLDDAVLAACYGIDRPASSSDEIPAPLEAALFAWRDAGCPGAPGKEYADPLAELDARALALGGSLCMESDADGHIVTLHYNLTGEPETARGTGATRAEAAAMCLAACPKPHTSGGPS